MESYDQSVEINHNPNWSCIPDHPYRILIIAGSGSGKTNVLLNLIKKQRPDIDKIYLFVKDPSELKYELLINERENVEIKKLNNPKAFIDYSQAIDDVYDNLEDYNPTKKRRMLIVFDYMIANMESNKKSSLIVTKFFLRARNLNILLFVISQCYFKVSKTIRLNATLYFIMKFPNKRELQQIASNHLFKINFKDFMKLYKDYTKEPY